MRESQLDEIRIPWDLYRMPRDRFVRLGEDPQFPQQMVAAPEIHTRWAEAMIDHGLFEQASMQLAMLDPHPRVCWLRARLGLVVLSTHRRWASTYREDYPRGFGEPGGDARREAIRDLLETAMVGEASNGGVWLTSAQFYLAVAYPRDPARAVGYARRAHELLGDRPDVLLTLGRAARAVDSYAEAVVAFRAAPESEEAGRELALAEMEVAAQAEPLDAEICSRLGRHYLHVDDRDRAAALYNRLHQRFPDRAEGHYGLGWLEFTQPQRSWVLNAEMAFPKCRQALACNERYGPAHELLGLIYGVDRSHSDNPTYVVGDRFECFRRALELDPTCGHAARFLAEEHLDRGKLEAAVELLERAVELESRDNWVYLVLAVVYEGRRQPARSEEMTDLAHDLNPRLELTGDYRQRILDLCGFQY